VLHHASLFLVGMPCLFSQGFPFSLDLITYSSLLLQCFSSSLDFYIIITIMNYYLFILVLKNILKVNEMLQNFIYLFYEM
jgi:hypothetical protein